MFSSYFPCLALHERKTLDWYCILLTCSILMMHENPPVEISRLLWDGIGQFSRIFHIKVLGQVFPLCFNSRNLNCHTREHTKVITLEFN